MIKDKRYTHTIKGIHSKSVLIKEMAINFNDKNTGYLFSLVGGVGLCQRCILEVHRARDLQYITLCYYLKVDCVDRGRDLVERHTHIHTRTLYANQASKMPLV